MDGSLVMTVMATTLSPIYTNMRMVTPMNTSYQPQHQLDSPKFGTFLFFPDSYSVSIHFDALDTSPHDVVIQFPSTALCAGEIFTFTRSTSQGNTTTTFNTGTFSFETAREIWKCLVADGWIVNTF